MRYDDMGVCKWDTTPYCHEIIGTDRDKWGNTCKTWRRLGQSRNMRNGWERIKWGKHEEPLETSERTTFQCKTSRIARPLKDWFLPENEGFSSLPWLFQFSANRGFLMVTVGFWMVFGLPSPCFAGSPRRRCALFEFTKVPGRKFCPSWRPMPMTWSSTTRWTSAQGHDGFMMGSWCFMNHPRKKKHGWFPKGPCLKIGLIQVVRPSVLLFFNVFQLIDLPVSDEQGYILLCPSADISERSSSTKVGASQRVSLRHSSHDLRGKWISGIPNLFDAKHRSTVWQVISTFTRGNHHFLFHDIQSCATVSFFDHIQGLALLDMIWGFTDCCDLVAWLFSTQYPTGLLSVSHGEDVAFSISMDTQP